MAKMIVTPGTEASETGNIIQEYAAKVAQALEIETARMRERAEQDSNDIISRSRKEADKIIAQAQEQARNESDKLIVALKEQAEQILEESREQAFIEARRQSAGVLNETREKIAQIITETLENGVAQAKSNLLLTASEARTKLESEKTKLFAVTRNIEQIINDTETNMKAGIEHLAAVISETEKKFESIIQIPETDLDSVKSPPQANVTPVKTIYTVKLKKQEPEPTVQEEMSVTNEIPAEPEAIVEPEEMMQRGLNLLGAGKNEEALVAFEKVIEIEPKNAIAWRKKGATLDKLGRHDESLKAYGKAIDLAPNYISECLSSELAIARKTETEADEIEKAKKEIKKQRMDATSKLNSISRMVTSKFL